MMNRDHRDTRITWHQAADGKALGHTEASTLGWSPGHWPETFTYACPPASFMTLYRKDDERSPEGELEAVTYEHGGILLRVAND